MLLQKRSSRKRNFFIVEPFNLESRLVPVERLAVLFCLTKLKSKVMKLTAFISLALLPFLTSAQLIGMEEYIPVDEYRSVSDKIYITTNGDYDYQVLDALDGVIYADDVPLVYREAKRIIEMNGGNMDEYDSLNGSIESVSVSEIKSAIFNGDDNIAVRWDLPSGYHVYLNLQDLFCGVGVTMDKAITKN
jgi:hypothetical protein